MLAYYMYFNIQNKPGILIRPTCNTCGRTIIKAHSNAEHLPHSRTLRTSAGAWRLPTPSITPATRDCPDGRGKQSLETPGVRDSIPHDRSTPSQDGVVEREERTGSFLRSRRSLPARTGRTVYDELQTGSVKVRHEQTGAWRRCIVWRLHHSQVMLSCLVDPLH